MVRLLALGFILMGCAVAPYNYISFRLTEPPYNLPLRSTALLFLGYAAAPVASLQFGRLSQHLGHRRAIAIGLATILTGLALTLSRPLWIVAAGMLILTAGFFGAHAVTSAWVGGRAHVGRAQATTLYLMFYYLGGSVIGAVGGGFWTADGWLGVAGFLAVAVILGLALALSVRGHDAVDRRDVALSGETA
jgi:YNFM family putative membrane transporter